MSDHNLTIISPDLSQQAIQEVVLIYTQAYAEAALTGLDKGFDGSLQDLLLDDAFDNLTAILEARALPEARALDQGFDIADMLKQAEMHRLHITKHVKESTLPRECLDAFNSAHSVAIADEPRTAWIAEAARKEAEE